MSGEDADCYAAMQTFLRGKLAEKRAVEALRLIDVLIEDEERFEFIRLLQKWAASK